MRTSDGLIELLIRNGIKPTYDSKKDVEIAKSFMPPGLTGQTTKTKKTDSIKSSNKQKDINK